MRSSPATNAQSAEPEPTGSESWVNRASQTKLRAMASGVGLAVFGSAVLVEKLSKHSEGSSKVLMAWNAVAGFAAGWMAMKMIEGARERRKNIAQRLKMIGDLNHHVRNALQSIQLSAYSTQDQAIIASVGDSVQRIEWALREIVPEH
jgi:hypothetical protein